MTAAAIGAAATLVAALAGFAANYFLKWRDERRQGGAAERLLQADLTRARDELRAGRPSLAEAGKPVATAGLGERLQAAIGDLADKGVAAIKDLRPGLDDSAVSIWREQWERFAARFPPPLWERIDGVVDTLDRFWEQVEADPELATAAFMEAREAARDAVPESPDLAERTWSQRQQLIRDLEATIELLKQRRNRWMRRRPWVGPALAWPDWQHMTAEDKAHARKLRRGRRARILVAAVLAMAVVVACGFGVRELVESLGDPIDAAAVEAELRDMEPDADVVNCDGDDAADRWSCSLTVDSCYVAQITPLVVACTERRDMFDVSANEKARRIRADLIDSAQERTKPLPPRREKRRRRWLRGLNWGWTGTLGRDDRPGTPPVLPSFARGG